MVSSVFSRVFVTDVTTFLRGASLFLSLSLSPSLSCSLSLSLSLKIVAKRSPRSNQERFPGNGSRGQRVTWMAILEVATRIHDNMLRATPPGIARLRFRHVRRIRIGHIE